MKKYIDKFMLAIGVLMGLLGFCLVVKEISIYIADAFGFEIGISGSFIFCAFIVGYCISYNHEKEEEKNREIENQKLVINYLKNTLKKYEDIDGE